MTYITLKRQCFVVLLLVNLFSIDLDRDGLWECLDKFYVNFDPQLFTSLGFKGFKELPQALFNKFKGLCVTKYH